MNSVTLIAENEFGRIIKHPFITLTVILLIIMDIIYAGSSSTILPTVKALEQGDVFLRGLGNPLHDVAMILSFFSMCVGIITISTERARGSLRVLMVKPVYLKEIILGKILGMMALLLIITSLVVTLHMSLMMISYGMPIALDDAILRILSYILALFGLCVLTAAATMLIGIIFKDLRIALIVSISYLYVMWFSMVPSNIEIIRYIDLMYLYQYIIHGGGNNLFDTSHSYELWLLSALPYIGAMIVEILAFLFLSISAFNKEEA